MPPKPKLQQPITKRASLPKQVIAALLVHDGRVLIAKRGPDDKHPNKWEFPGGKVEAGESPEACLVRELHEEFGITVTYGDYFGESLYDYGQGQLQLLAYWASWKGGQVEPVVHDEVAWVAFKDLPNYDFLPADLPFVETLKTLEAPPFL